MSIKPTERLEQLGNPRVKNQAPSFRSAAKAHLGRIIYAEWIKLRSTSSTWICLILGSLLTTASSVGLTNVLWKLGVDRDHPQTLQITLSQALHTAQFAGEITRGWIVGLLFFIVLAALFAGSEYTTGLALNTFSVVPQRGRVVVAKMIVLGGVVFLFAALTQLSTLVLCKLVIGASFGQIVGTGTGVIWLNLFLTALSIVLVVEFSLCLAFIFRSVAATLTTTIGFIYLVSLFWQVLSGQWSWANKLHAWMIDHVQVGLTVAQVKGTAKAGLRSVGNYSAGSAILHGWQLATATLIWLVVPAIIEVALVKRRDV